MLIVNFCMKINNVFVGNDLIVFICSLYMDLLLYNYYIFLVFFFEVIWYCNMFSINRIMVYLYVRNVGMFIIVILFWMNRILNKIFGFGRM